MASLREVIENSNFLLDFQKEALIEKLGANKAAETITDKRLNLMTFLDEVFRKLFGKGIEEALSTQEQGEVKYILNDLVGITDD